MCTVGSGDGKRTHGPIRTIVENKLARFFLFSEIMRSKTRFGDMEAGEVELDLRITT